MKLNRKWGYWLLLLLPVVLIRSAAAFPAWVEAYYATGIYPLVSTALKYLSGWLPFSLGDVIYGGLIAWLIFRLVRLFRTTRFRSLPKETLRVAAKRLMVALIILYTAFNLLWGLNYNRLGITHQLDIRHDSVSPADLRVLDSLLLQRVNTAKSECLAKAAPVPTGRAILFGAVQAYEAAARQHPFLQYRPAAVKPSLWGWAGNYIGFTGYYNPFTGEAQVNTGAPYFLLPYTACHEIAHQLGYARENEANLVGYLAASQSPDPLFRYSVYLDLFVYTQRALYPADSASVKNFAQQLLPEVRADLRTWQAFLEAHRSPLEPVFRKLYGFYLEKNEQPAGINSYDEVTTSLVAYYRKYGRL